jgi:hypothetical protein
LWRPRHGRRRGGKSGGGGWDTGWIKRTHELKVMCGEFVWLRLAIRVS